MVDRFLLVYRMVTIAFLFLVLEVISVLSFWGNGIQNHIRTNDTRYMEVLAIDSFCSQKIGEIAYI